MLQAKKRSFGGNILPRPTKVFYRGAVLIIDIKNLLVNSEDALPLEFELDFSAFELAGEHPITDPVKIVGKVENHAGIVTLGYLAMFTLNTQCDRCLTKVAQTFNQTYNHTIVLSLNAEYNDNFILCENGKLNFFELAWADILLDLPAKYVCKEQCKGLCPVCGINLNEQSCNCGQKTIDPRLQVLADLLKNSEE